MSISGEETTRCEVCGNEHLQPVLNLGSHPMCDDLVPIGDDRVCKEYPIEILFCDQCRTAHQRFQVPKHELFPPTYHYRSRHTADVLNGMSQLVEACQATLGSLSGLKVLDIGCNDGSLLSIFAGKGAKTFGIEPTGAATDAASSGHDVLNEFLDEDVAARFVASFGQPDVVTFTNVFAHIEDLPAVLRSLKILAHDTTMIVIENHYLGSILQTHQFDTFYHEHPRTYSYRSFTAIADTLGMSVVEVSFPSRYGGNIRVFMQRGGVQGKHDRWDELEEKERHFGSGLRVLSQSIDNWHQNKTQQLQEATREHGALAAKAFPGRSAIPVKMLGIDVETVSAVYEKPASGKIGHYVPGTRIPILSDDEFDARSASGPVVNMAWHIGDEIRAYLRGRGYEGGLIDIIAAEDFRS